MTTAAVTLAPAATETFLQKLGKWFVTKFQPVADDVLKVAQAVEPIVDVALPAWAGLYNTTVQLIVNAEATAAAAGAQNGTGTQKLSTVIAALEPLAVSYLKNELGISNPTTEQITAYVNSVVAGLNVFSTLTGAAVPPAAASTTT